MNHASVGVAVLGAGSIAEYHLGGLAAAGHAGVRVLAARTRERAAPLAQRFGIAEVMTDWRAVLERKDVDAVIVCTPDDTHEEITIAAAQAGKAILLQKPMAGTVEAGQRILDAATRAGVDLQVSFMHRWFPEVAQARTWLAEGAIGTLRSVRMRNATPGPDWGDWFFAKSQVSNGVVDQLGVHGIDLALQLVGNVARVSARSAILKPTRTLRDGRVVAVENSDTANATYDFAGGALGTHEMSQIEVAGCDRFRMELYGDAGTIWLRTERGSAALYAPALHGKQWHCPTLAEEPLGKLHHAAWLAGVFDPAIRAPTARDALRGMQVVAAIQKSSEQAGQSVLVAETSACASP
jgi:predicted dehydrogenase